MHIVVSNRECIKDLEDARYVDIGEVFLLWSANLDFENIIAESAETGVSVINDQIPMTSFAS